LYKEIGSESARIQWILKFPIPTIFSIINPNFIKRLPKLNTLLIPAINSLAESEKVSKIYVAPINTQLEILRDIYLFVPTDEPMIAPCNLTINQNRTNLVKQLR
jgi:hypothetical protein